MKPAVSCLLLALWPLACSDPLKEAQQVDSLRVLAARVEVSGEPRRAAPRPGEAASVRWLVVAPEGEPELGWGLGVCAARPSNIGLSSCAGDPFARDERPAAPGSVALDFEVPPELDTSAVQRLLVQGAICEAEAPLGELAAAECAGGSGSAVSLEFELAHEGDENTNPEFGAEPLAFDAVAWPVTEPGSAACRGSGLLEVPAGSPEHAIQIAVSDDARDPLARVITDDPEREALLISHFSNDAGLERPFSSLGASAPESSVEVQWRAPERAPAEGQLVRFWFVLRDLRGGSAYTERALCVVP